MPKKDDVFAAADELRTRGERVSTRRIMGVTGGSFRDVCPMLDRWRKERGVDDARTDQAVVDDKTAYMTPDAEHAVVKHLERVWQIAFAEARRCLEEREERMRRREEDIKVALDEALDRALMAEEAFETLSRHVADAALPVEVRPFRPADRNELEDIWTKVRAFAEAFALRQGGTFTTYQIEANLPPILNARLRRLGRPRLTGDRISEKFRRRGWFEAGEAICEFRIGADGELPRKRKRRTSAKAA